MDVNDVNVNVNVVASSNHANVSTSSYSLSSSDPSTNNNNNSTNQSSSNVNVINVCDGTSDKTNTNHGIIITESHDGASFYDAIKLEESGGTTTAIIYETIVIENPQQHGHELVSFMTGNNNKLMANKNVALDNGGIIVLTGSLNDLLLSQNGHVITNQSSNGAGANIKCLNDVTNPNHIQSIVLNLNSQSSAPATSIGAGQLTPAGQKSIMLAISQNQQVSDRHAMSSFRRNLFYSVNNTLNGISLTYTASIFKQSFFSFSCYLMITRCTKKCTRRMLVSKCNLLTSSISRLRYSTCFKAERCQTFTRSINTKLRQ